MGAIGINKVRKVFGDAVAVDDVKLDIHDGEFVVIVGPSGCGKTTLLRLIAGLETLTDGEILLDSDPISALPASKRDIAMVFQSYALYPHMSVERNIGYPLKQQRVAKAEIYKRVRQVASSLGIRELLDRKPGELSGGQRQRVALGRAIIREPQAFLMDEPLSNLDAKLRSETRSEIIDLQRRLGVTTIYVTHDQIEAMTMGDRVAIMNEGRLQQFGPPLELFAYPANTFVASFLGNPPMNLLAGHLESSAGARRLVLSGGRDAAIDLPQSLPIPDKILPGGDGVQPSKVWLGVRPRAPKLTSQVDQSFAPGRSVRLTAPVLRTELHGDVSYATTNVGGHDFTVTLDKADIPSVLHLNIDADDLRWFDSDGQAVEATLP